MFVAGLMSGTSLDAMDAGLLHLSSNRIQQCKGITIAFSSGQRKVLQHAVDQALVWQFDGAEPAGFSAAAQLIASIGALAIEQLLKQNGLQVSDLSAIGLHGQTVLHQPPTTDQLGQSLQLGDAQGLADVTQTRVVYDFRSADLLNRGHGAPLAPAWHFELAKKRGVSPCAFVNIGGVSNLTFIPTLTGDNPQAAMIAFDCGPGNGPLDGWIQAHQLGQMDANGQYAAKGQADPRIVAKIIAKLPVAGQVGSLDRWAFDHDCVSGLSVADGAATLLEITAQGILRAVQALPIPPVEIIIGGGGRRNPVLMQRLEQIVSCPILPCEAMGQDGDLVEAEAFAWLAAQRLANQPGSWPGTTGAVKPVVGGVICDPCGGF